jgi:hypothetical protein
MFLYDYNTNIMTGNPALDFEPSLDTLFCFSPHPEIGCPGSDLCRHKNGVNRGRFSYTFIMPELRFSTIKDDCLDPGRTGTMK